MAIAILSFSQQSNSAQGSYDGPEQILFQSANRERAARALPPLQWNPALADAARSHAVLLARKDTLSHQLPGEAGLAERTAHAGARFSTIAENVAEGQSAEKIHEQWMKSPPHRGNLLDPQLDSIGIAVAGRNGTMFAVEDFAQSVAELSLREQEELVEAQLHSRGLQILSYTEDARRTCVLDSGYAGSHRPSFVLHYATTDLRSLPDMLGQRVQSGRYHAAAVGSCRPDSKQGFSSYRIAVLLYE
jgi:cysteine-rich secretory family protein